VSAVTWKEVNVASYIVFSSMLFYSILFYLFMCCFRIFRWNTERRPGTT